MLRRIAVSVALALAVAAATVPAASADPDYRFISSPDFLNQDVGTLAGTDYWDGSADSTSPSHEAALETAFSTWERADPDQVYVAGDFVEGHWDQDYAGAGYFGPMGTAAEREAAVRRAGAVYYGQIAQRFLGHDLTLLPAIGDHEIGDNPWSPSAAKYALVRTFKNVFARHLVRPRRFAMRPPGPASRTAYARYVDAGRKVLLVSVDVFESTPSGVRRRLDAQQLRWLDGVLSRARRRGTDWVIVQGHVPVLGPVRKTRSSGLMYMRGRESAFWRTLRRNEVDLYLCGEVHNVTMRRADKITQISHGGIWPTLTSYLQGTVTGGRMRLQMNRFDFEQSGPALWGNDPRKTKGSILSGGTRRQTGRMVLTKDRRVVTERGELVRYR